MESADNRRQGQADASTRSRMVSTLPAQKKQLGGQTRRGLGPGRGKVTDDPGRPPTMMESTPSLLGTLDWGAFPLFRFGFLGPGSR